MATLKEVKAAIRQPYAWPGGYPLFAIMGDGEAMSITACRENWREIVGAHLKTATIGRYYARDNSWYVEAIAVNWEDPSLYCVHTGERIESAYAEDDTIENGGTGELTTD